MVTLPVISGVITVKSGEEFQLGSSIRIAFILVSWLIMDVK